MKTFFVGLLVLLLAAAAGFGGYKLGFRNGAIYAAGQQLAAVLFQMGYNAGLEAQRT